MDYGARFYVNQNTVGDLTKDTRNQLLGDAFLYHLISAVEASIVQSNSTDESVKNHQQENLNEFIKIRKMTKVKPGDIFERGLAARFGTSSALKYLACFGLTCEVRPAFGSEFEELTALHYMRLMQVQGYEVKRVILSHAWPPKANKNDEKIDASYINSVRNGILLEQKKTELMDFCMPQSQKACVIFSQGTPTAQGGDVLVLLKYDKSYHLEVIQCKHRKNKDEGTKTTLWWNSLGITCQNNEWNFTPDKGNAGYSYAGMVAFMKLLEERLDVKVKLGKRTMAVSFPMPKRAKFPKPQGNCARVWFREMFEPTISTFFEKLKIVDEPS
jgi:hypothetical protein